MFVALFLFMAILGILVYLDTRKPKNFPPGPKWWPIFGSAIQVITRRKRTGYLYKATAELADKYGPVVGLKVGKDYVIIVYGNKALKEFLTSEDLAGRPQGIFYDMRTWGQRRGILLTDSEFWQEQRRFVLRQLREFGFGRKNMSTMIQDETSILVDNLKKMIKENGGSVTIDVETLFNIHILNTLWTMLAGIRYSSEDKDLKHLQRLLSDLFANVDMVGALFSHFPILRIIAPGFSGYNKYVNAHIPLWEFLNKELQKHKETYRPNEPRDFIDVYLQILQSPERKESFSEQQLMAICLDMFMAGSETTSHTLDFAFLYLLLFPEVQKKAQQEIDLVLGREKPPSLEDRPNMPYMECVVLEALRMFSGRAFSVPHRAMRDTVLCGYTIPKESIVVANLNGVLMGKECGFDDPEDFRPERYMKDGKISTLPDTYIPFGFGKHRCMGETLAKANLFMFISHLLQHFDFAIPPNCPPSMECIDGVTPGPKHFKALVTLRK